MAAQAKPAPAELNPDSFMASGGGMASASLPQPEEVDQMTTTLGRALAEQLTRPASSPIPYALQTDQQQIAGAPTFQNPRTGKIYHRQAPGKEGGPLGVLDAPITGAQKVGEGAAEMTRPGMDSKFSGASKIVRGGFEASTPLMAGSLATAPVKTALSVGAGMASTEAVEAGLKKIGVPPGLAAFAGDAAGLFAGIGVHGISPRAASAIKAKYEPILKSRAEKANAPEASASITGREPYTPKPDLNPDTFTQETYANRTKQATPENQPADSGPEKPVAAVSAAPGGGAAGAPEGGGAAAQHPKAKGAVSSGELFRGKWNIPLTEKGVQDARDVAQRTAGQFTEIHASPLGRAQQTAAEVAKTNPQAGAVQTKTQLEPWTLGQHEGEQVTPERVDDLNDRIRNRPDEKIPGAGQHSNAPGESFNDFKDPLISHVQEQAARWQPGQKILNVTHYRDIRGVEAWLKNGKPEDRSIDVGHMTTKGDEKPGDLFRWDPRRQTLQDAKNADQDGIYFLRHGETAANEGASGGKIAANGTDTRREGPALHGNAPSGAGSLTGEATDVVIPGEKRSIPARYEVRELADIKSSHNGITFSANPDYALKNERDYSKPENQQRVIEQSSEESFNPRFHVTDNPDMGNGPPLIDETGNAIGGNSRTMHLQRVYGRKGQAARDYRSLLERNAPHFGIDPAAIRQMREPVLTRVASDEGLDTLPGGAKWAIRKTNVSGTAALSASERAAADSAQMSPDMLSHIAGAIEDAGTDATLNDALTGKSGTVIVNRLISEGFFNEQERPGLMDGKTGALTQSAKDRISKAMLGKFFEDSDQISRTPASIKAKLERAAAPLAKVAGNPDWDITPDVKEAVNLIEYATAHGIRHLSDVVSQASMFGEGPKWSDGAVKLAELLRDGKPNDVVAAFRKYVNSKEPTMFGESTPDEAFQETFGAGKPERTATPVDAAATPVDAVKPESAERKTSFTSTPHSAPIDVPAPEPETKKPAPVTLASGFGALQPYYDAAVKSIQESAAEVKALKSKRDAALAALKASEITPQEKEHGQITRRWYTGERDLWGTRVNQAIERLKKLVPDHVEQEALSLMRDFKSRPGELQQFLLGTHPDLGKLPAAEYKEAMENLEKLRPAIERAQNPTPRMRAADAVLTKLADMSLAEGQKVGFLESSISPEEYVTHLLHPKDAGSLPVPFTERAKALGGKIGRQFSFGKERTIPTLLHAISYGLKPRTLNAFDAFTVHGDKFATARATHMLVSELKGQGIGKWGARAGQGGIPADWVEIAPHAHPFQNIRAFPGAVSTDQPVVSRQTLFVPKFIADSLAPITDPDYSGKIMGFNAARKFQALAKAGELSLSLFHLKAENYMALANMGPKGWAKAQLMDRADPAFLLAERDMVLHGGTSPVQGKTFEAYKALQPGSIPTWGDMVRKAPVIRQFDQAAGKITELIFDNQMRKFKVTNYGIRKAAWMAKHPNATPAETTAAMHSITQELNAVYGGLHWENLGVNRMTNQVSRFLMLAPDWTFSNFYNVKTMGEGGWKGTEGGQMARAFWLRAIVGGLAVNQGYSLLMSGKPSTNPTMAYEGKDSEGREIYRNVAFAGAPSDLVNLVQNVYHYGLLEGPARSLAGKAAPGLRTAFEMMFNEDFLHHKITDPSFSMAANTARTAWFMTKSLAPIPFSASNVIDVAMDGTEDQQAKAKDIIGLILFGQAARHVAPEGTHWTPRGGIRENRAKPERTFSEEFSQEIR